MLFIVKAEAMQLLADAEEVLFKGTLVAVTGSAIARFIIIDVLSTIQEIREQKVKRLRRKP